jgi:hypothetical protein
VHQAILVHADIDERAERWRRVTVPLEDHAALEIFRSRTLEHGLEGRARIAAGFSSSAGMSVTVGGQSVVDESLRLQRRTISAPISAS